MSLATHVLCFCVVSFATALATSAIRLRNPLHISRETVRFFLTITIGIFIFCGIVYVLEWIFIRPLL